MSSIVKKKNIVYISRLRAVSCIAIILLHTFYAFDSYAVNISQHTAMLTVRNLMMWAVPCFVMATGSLLLAPEKKLGFKKLFGQYILRMILALVIFTVLFSVFDMIFLPQSIDGNLFRDVVNDILFNNGWKHMWYLYMMIAVYLLMPFYKMITGAVSKNELLYLLAVYFVFMSVMEMTKIITGKSIAFYICVNTVYPLLLFCGYAVHNRILKINIPVSVVLTAVFIAVTWIMTGITVREKNAVIDNLLQSYGFPVTIAGSLGMFAIFKSTESGKWGVADKILTAVDKCSFGIYLIHMAVLKTIIVVFRFNPFEHGGFIMVLLISALVFAVSYLVTALLKLIPFVRKLI